MPLTRPAIERYKNLELLVDLTGYPTYVNRVMYSELRGALVSAFRSGFFSLSLCFEAKIWFGSRDILFLQLFSWYGNADIEIF